MEIVITFCLLMCFIISPMAPFIGLVNPDPKIASITTAFVSISGISLTSLISSIVIPEIPLSLL